MAFEVRPHRRVGVAFEERPHRRVGKALELGLGPRLLVAHEHGLVHGDPEQLPHEVAGGEMSAAVETARAFEAAWQGKELEKARGHLADVVFDSPFGHETTAEAAMGQYAGFVQAVSGPAREIAAFGDDLSALIMSEIPTATFGTVVSAAHYMVRDGKITSETIVYDATAAKTQQP